MTVFYLFTRQKYKIFINNQTFGKILFFLLILDVFYRSGIGWDLDIFKNVRLFWAVRKEKTQPRTACRFGLQKIHIHPEALVVGFYLFVKQLGSP